MNRRQLLGHLLATDGYVSGELLSKRYGVSRQSIWKHINALNDEGYQIESVRRKGYRLVEQNDISKNEIAKLAYNSALFDDGQFLDTIDSTNSYAKARANQLNSALIVAAEQTAGRGRLGRSWQADAAGSLCFSMLLRPQIAPQLAAMLTQVAALALCRAIEQSVALDVQIKWPNDIVLGGKKVAGILTEMASELNAVEYVVIGIGVNVSTARFNADLAPIATSLALQGNRAVSRLTLLERFIAQFSSCYQQFIGSGDLTFIEAELNRLSQLVGRAIWIIDGKARRPATAKRINARGELVVDVGGVEQRLYYGEVSVRLSDGSG